MPSHWNTQKLMDIRDKEIFSSDGEKIGSVRAIYYDDATREPEWVGIGTGFFGMQEKLVPAEVLEFQGDDLRVPFTKDKVKEEPNFKLEDGRLSNADEIALCQYFGISGEHNHITRMLKYGDPYVR